jgi:uncharacterized protein (UPF0548 family)
VRLTVRGAFERGRQGLRTWQAHLGAGARIFPEGDFNPGETVLVVLAIGPIQVVAPCRIVYVIDEPDRFGFAYGTLQGHPEEGEEAFVVERLDPGHVQFGIRAFSRPADALARAIGPIGRLVQTRMTKRYQRGLQRWVQSSH